MEINTGVQHNLRYPAARFSETGCLPVWGGDAVRTLNNGLLMWTNNRTTPEYPHNSGILIPILAV